MQRLKSSLYIISQTQNEPSKLHKQYMIAAAHQTKLPFFNISLAKLKFEMATCTIWQSNMTLRESRKI